MPLCAATCLPWSQDAAGNSSIYMYTWLQSGRHFKFKLFWLRPENGHQMALEWVSGDGFG